MDKQDFDKLVRGVRELALLDLAVDSKLRACDLVALRVRYVTVQDADADFLDASDA